jgi:phospholipase C
MLPLGALVILCSASILCACSLGAAGSGPKPNPAPTPITQAFIKHVVIIVQENRTVDNLFNGFPGADTVTSGLDSHGNVVHLTRRKLWQVVDPDHSHRSFVLAYDGGRMNGFDLVPNQDNIPLYSYSYTDPAQVQPYWNIAKSYAFGDRMFQSNSGPSFPAHLYLIASQSPDAAENPNAPIWGCDSPAGTTVVALNQNGQEYTYGFPCFDFPTLADEMDATGVSWRYYTPLPTGIWSAFDAIAHIRHGPDWTRNIATNSGYTPVADFAAGNVPSVTWVVPDGFNSDHPNGAGDHGPDWVASLVNAIGQGPEWNSTAIFIVWDDWGGWYDHVAPSQLDVMGLGMRVPLIVVSPYARRGYVSHVNHEFGSIMRFTEETFGLPTMSAADRRADDLLDCFDFTKPPSQFHPFAFVHAPVYSGNSVIGAVPADNE